MALKTVTSLAIILFLQVLTTIAADLSGEVVGVLDGDTIEVMHNHHAEHIRLNGIDCPEKGQVFGQRAKQTASRLGYGKEVPLETFGKDKYGRTIADVLLPDGTNVKHASQRRLVLVASEVCGGSYGARKVRA
jgi:endonuclease YncB( thermonuclease family)